jgi:hypothetical protein
MNKISLSAALIVASLTLPAFAQNVQDRNAPQNPKDVTPASPASQGATDNPTTGQSDQTGQPKSKHHKRMHHKKDHGTSGSSGSSGNAAPSDNSTSGQSPGTQR